MEPLEPIRRIQSVIFIFLGMVAAEQRATLVPMGVPRNAARLLKTAAGKTHVSHTSLFSRVPKSFCSVTTYRPSITTRDLMWRRYQWMSAKKIHAHNHTCKRTVILSHIFYALSAMVRQTVPQTPYTHDMLSALGCDERLDCLHKLARYFEMLLEHAISECLRATPRCMCRRPML